MDNNLYKNFLSTGFKQANEKNAQHQVDMYQYNLAEHLPKDRAAKILEIGSGMGRFLEFLGTRGYDDFLGVDLSEEAVRYCQDKGIEKVKLITDLDEFLVSSVQYDAIVMNDVIEHIPKQEVVQVLTKLHEKLKVGGKLIVKTGNMSSIIGARMRYVDFTHELGFTEESLSQLLKICNFRDIIIRPFVFPKTRLTRVIRWLFQKGLHAWVKMVYFFEFTRVPEIVDEVIFAVGRK
jgi:2-polyprenyl-3-methyl-5-hydroxy-6-metoxy-1,4-benzoquinol methylase